MGGDQLKTPTEEAQDRLEQLVRMRRSGHVDPFVVDYLDGLIAESERWLKQQNGLTGSTR